MTETDRLLAMSTTLTAPTPLAVEPAAAVTSTEIAKPQAPLHTLITVEHGIYALLLLASLVLRLAALGAAPLSPAEAAASWPAWLDAWGVQIDHAQQPTSALLHALQVLIFWVSGGGTDWLARLPVAFFSASLALLPWFWRARLGRVAAVTLALLLAVDPWLLTLGRSANATLLSVTLALVALTALEQSRYGGATPLYIAAVATGLLLVSGPQAWSWLVVLALYLLLIRPPFVAVRPASEESEPQSRSGWAGPLVAGAAAALLGATGWLAQPAELAMVSASLNAWLAQGTSGPYPFAWPWLRLLVDQPFVLLFAIVGLIALRHVREELRRERFFLLAWLVWGILLFLLPGRSPDMLPIAGIALLICAALGVQALWRMGQVESDWRDAGLMALVLATILLSLLFWAAGLVYAATTPVTDALVAAAMLLVAALLLVGFAFFAGGRQALVVGVGVSGLLLFAAGLSATWQLVYVHEPAHPDGFFAAVALRDARALTEDVEGLSFRRTGDATELPIQVVTGPQLQPDPHVGWLLRTMRNVRFVAGPESAPDTRPGRDPLVITTSLVGSESWNAAFVGSEYRLRQAWLPSALTQQPAAEGASTWGTRGRPWLRWLIYRDAAPPESGSVILWARP